MEIISNAHSVGMLSLPRELCIMFGEHLDAQTLGCLVRVCREFRDLFTPILYTKWYSSVVIDGPKMIKFDPLPSNISLAKEVEVIIDGELRVWDEQDFEEDSQDEEVQKHREERIPRLKKAVTDYVSRIMELASSVKTLKLSYCIYKDIFTNESFRRSLQACTKLRNVRITYLSRSLIRSPSFQQFQNLSSLELYHVSDVTAEVEGIAKVLSRCPQLKILVLTDTQYHSSMPHSTKWDIKNALEHLCDYYHTTCKSKPLKLSRLDLPAGLSPIKPASGRDDNYLENLTNTSVLTDLAFYNGLVTEDTTTNTPQLCRIDYGLLENVVSLRRLKITLLDSAVRTWMDDGLRNSADLRDFRVTFPYSMFDPLLKEFEMLNLSQLSILSTKEVTHVLSAINITVPPPQNQKPPGYDVLAPYTILDRLSGHGRSLVKLGIYLDFTTQWDQFSAHLSNMKFLTHLCIGQRRSGTDGLMGPNPEPFWVAHLRRYGPVIQKDALGYIKIMSELCPSLRYVKIGSSAWYIGVGSQTSIRELDEREERDDEFLLEHMFWFA